MRIRSIACASLFGLLLITAAAAQESVVEPTTFRLKEDQKGTVLELNFPISAFIPAGAKRLPLIVAYGRRDNLTGYHSMRTGLEIRL